MMKLHEIINEFLSDDELRPVLCTPYRDGELVVATDAHTIIVAPTKYFESPPQQDDPGFRKYPDYNKVIPEPEKEPVAIITLERFDTEYSKLKRHPIFGDCKKCEGVGMWDDENDDHVTCGLCDGDGESDEEIGTGIDSGQYFLINTIAFNPTLLKRLFEVARIIGVSELCFYSIKKSLPALAIIGDIKLLVMPMMVTAHEDAIVNLN